MSSNRIAASCLGLTIASAAHAQPYDFSEADLLLNAALPSLAGHVAVVVRQGGVDLYRFQAGDIGYDTRARLASFPVHRHRWTRPWDSSTSLAGRSKPRRSNRSWSRRTARKSR